MVLTLLLFARVWARALDLILPLGFLLLLLATSPQFVSYLYLVRLLDNPDDAAVSLQMILVPNAASWLAMWCSGFVIAYGLRQKERLRDVLLATGAVWTHHENLARRMHGDQEAVRQRIDALSEEVSATVASGERSCERNALCVSTRIPSYVQEVAKLVDIMMAGKDKPNRLKRVGNTLYKRLQEAVEGVASDGSSQLTAADGPPLGAAAAGSADREGKPTPEELSPLASPSLPDHVVVQVCSPGSSSVPQVQEEGGPQRRLDDSERTGDDDDGHPPQVQGHAASTAAAGEDVGSDSNNSTVGDLGLFPPSDPLSKASGPSHSAGAGSSVEPRTSSQGVVAGALMRTVSGRSAVRVQPASHAVVAGGVPDHRPSSAGLLAGIARNLGLDDGMTAAAAGGDPGLAAAARASAAAAAASQEDGGDDLCIICYDQPSSCVFLECGHSGFCRRCANLLFVRPPCECPTCRQAIEQVVELEEVRPIGQVTSVKQQPEGRNERIAAAAAALTRSR